MTTSQRSERPQLTDAAADTRDNEIADSTALGRQIRTGLGWSFLNNVLGRAGTLIAGIVLARLLDPQDYGVFAVALVAMNLLMSLNDAGMTAAVVRWPGRVDDIAPTAATLILAFSIALYAILWVAAPPFAAAFGVPEATGILRLLAVTIIIDGLFALPTALLTRSFLQGRRTTADLANLVVSSVIAILLAKQGYGAWSLAWGRLAGNMVSGLVIVALAPRRPRPGFRVETARNLLAYGLPLTGSSLLVFAMLNVDTVIVGRLLGPVSLGFYVLAFNLSSWPVNMFSFAVRRVSLAGFARIADDRARLRAAYLRSLALLLAVSLPVCVLLATLSLPTIRFVYGDKWAEASVPLHWLALLGVVRVATELTYDLILAIGRPRAVFRLQLLWVIALIPALALGARIGGIGEVAAGHLLVGLLIVLPAFGYELRHVEIRMGDIARALARPAVAALIAVVTSIIVMTLVDTSFLQLIAAGAAGLIAYAVVVAPMRRLIHAPLAS